MNATLEWITAIAAVIAAAGGLAGWLGAARARLQLRAETLRNSQDRRENELHRQRLAEVWHYWHDMPDSPERTEAARWYSEWTGAARPRRGGTGSGSQPPGFGCRDADDAYDRYIAFLAAVYQPGRLGPPRPALDSTTAATGQ
jgi:hypothetical protein